VQNTIHAITSYYIWCIYLQSFSSINTFSERW